MKKKRKRMCGVNAMILKDLLKTFFLSTTKICVIGWDEMMGDRVVYNGRVDRFLAMEFTDPTFEKTLKCEVERIDNSGTKYINIYCDQYHEPLTREKIMEAFAKYNGGRTKNDCE